MSYVQDNLLHKELIKYEGKVHGFYLFMMSCGVLIGILFLIPYFSTGHGFNLITGGVITSMFIYKIFYILTTEMVVTNKRVLYKTGVISRNVFELQLNKIESAELDQTIFERIIGAGTLVISGTGGHNKPIINLASPIEMRGVIYRKIENI